jgi:hypothetical protein
MAGGAEEEPDQGISDHTRGAVGHASAEPESLSPSEFRQKLAKNSNLLANLSQQKIRGSRKNLMINNPAEMEAKGVHWPD